jgi:HTH-type transcriptional regulator/antitoxin HigA
MITNDRQYKTTMRQFRELERAISEMGAGVGEAPSPDWLAKASREALASEAGILRAEISEYEALLARPADSFVLSSLAELPRDLIRARITKGLSQRELADLLGLKEQQVQRYEATQYAAASLRRLQEIATALGLEVPTTRALEGGETKSGVPNEPDWNLFPVAEMYRRGWFPGFEGSLDAAKRSADSLVKDFLEGAFNRPTMALHRKHIRTGSILDENALLVWEARLLTLASQMEVKAPYAPGSIDDSWIAGLVGLSRFEDGPLRARAALAEVGIPLVVEPHLAGTHLDGASLLRAGTPVIGLTLRYDRVDSFWFVLMHELFHVLKHLRKDKLNSTFDDLEASSGDAIEVEADALAAESLIPAVQWEQALARYVRSPAAVEQFAAQIGVSPAIVAGRIRHEANNYVILSGLVGAGRVRGLFPEYQCCV